MRQNNIETAREFLKGSGLVATEPDIKNLVRVMIDYHTYLTATDSDGQKSAEIILQEQKDKFPYNWGRNAEHMAAYVPNEIALKAMHEFAAQSSKELTDEEIKNEAEASITMFQYDHVVRQMAFIDGAKWARTKLTGK